MRGACLSVRNHGIARSLLNTTLDWLEHCCHSGLLNASELSADLTNAKELFTACSREESNEYRTASMRNARSWCASRTPDDSSEPPTPTPTTKCSTPLTSFASTSKKWLSAPWWAVSRANGRAIGRETTCCQIPPEVSSESTIAVPPKKVFANQLRSYCSSAGTQKELSNSKVTSRRSSSRMHAFSHSELMELWRDSRRCTATGWPSAASSS
mmetsp:Transcript_27245/g.67592  ORF Transcript_27245/g.67592 Transcript_27245/m.67592 type:complete len:212 (+) Transcript_27245:99-734(+)